MLGAAAVAAWGTLGPPSTAAPPAAAASPIAQAPPPAPRPPRVTLEFRSQPEGAIVYRSGETMPLGRTPFAAEFLSSDQIVPFHFRLAEHQDVTTEARLEPGQVVEAVLPAVVATVEPEVTPRREGDRSRDRRRARKPAAEERAQKTLNREGVVDPFAR
jgi:hypothetical protein